MNEPMEDQKTVRQRFILIVVTLGVGWVWIKYGVDALLGIGLIIGVVWASLRLGPGTGKRLSDPYEYPSFGPTDNERLFDSAYKNLYPENTFSDRK